MRKKISRWLLAVQLLTLGLGMLSFVPITKAVGSGVFLTDVSFSRTFYNTHSIVPGDTLYFEAESASANVNSGVADTVTIIVKTSSGDAEGRVLTETDVDTGIFRTSVTGGTTATDALLTSGGVSAKGSGTLYIVGSDTLTATFFEVSSATIVDDLSICLTPPPELGYTGPLWLTQFGATGVCHEAPTNGYFESILAAGPNPVNIGGALRQLSVIDYTARNVAFDFKVNNSNYLGQSNALGGTENVNGLTAVLIDSTTNFPSDPHQIKAEFTPFMTSVGNYVHVSIPQSEFQFTKLGGSVLPTQIDLSNIRLVYLTAVTNGTAITTDIKNLGYETGTTYTDTVSVGIANNVELTASVAPTLSYTLDTTNCSFGALTSATVNTCVINVAIATNATAGYSAYIRDVNNGTLNSGTDNINAVVGTTLDAGTEGFGVSTSVALQDLIQEPDCSAASLPINVQSVTTSNQAFSSADAPVPGDSIDLCMAASITDTTPAGSYSDTAYVTVVGNF